MSHPAACPSVFDMTLATWFRLYAQCIVRNRLKKKEWIDGLQRSNALIESANHELKVRIKLMEQEKDQLHTLLVQNGLADTGDLVA
jgi:hypothetical protein